MSIVRNSGITVSQNSNSGKHLFTPTHQFAPTHHFFTTFYTCHTIAPSRLYQNKQQQFFWVSICVFGTVLYANSIGFDIMCFYLILLLLLILVALTTTDHILVTLVLTKICICPNSPQLLTKNVASKSGAVTQKGVTQRA